MVVNGARNCLSGSDGNIIGIWGWALFIYFFFYLQMCTFKVTEIKMDHSYFSMKYDSIYNE